MHEKAKELIEEKADAILKDWDFDVRKETHPDECPCFKSGKCHDIEDLNCFFCLCPFYDVGKEEGGCLRNGDGKWFYGEKFLKGKIWDCSNCAFLHKKENAKNTLIQFLTGNFNR